jgi:hypothetical protein
VLPSVIGQVIKTSMYMSMVGPKPIPLRVSFPFLDNVYIVVLRKVVSTSKLLISLIGDLVSRQASISKPSFIINYILTSILLTEYSMLFKSIFIAYITL